LASEPNAVRKNNSVVIARRRKRRVSELVLKETLLGFSPASKSFEGTLPTRRIVEEMAVFA
jgi:hypothetical protein